MLSVNNFSSLGVLNGSIYDFELAGDVIHKHVHTNIDIHVTIVTKGKIKAYSHDWEVVADAGSILDFKEGEPHEIVALEDGTRIINILKNPVQNLNNESVDVK